MPEGPAPTGLPGGNASRRRARFPRAFRLKRRRLIRPLFDRNAPDVGVVRAGSVVVRYRIVPREAAGADVPLQVGVAAPRRLGSKPDRNRVRRVLRETFRVHQHALVDLFADRPHTLTLMLLYQGRRPGAEAAIQHALPDALDRLARRIADRPPSA